MKTSFKIILLLFIQFFFAQKSKNSYVITNVNIIPMNSEIVLKNKDVYIENGKIKAILNPNKVISKGLIYIDGTGKFIVPSLSDAHVH